MPEGIAAQEQGRSSTFVYDVHQEGVNEFGSHWVFILPEEFGFWAYAENI